MSALPSYYYGDPADVAERHQRADARRRLNRLRDMIRNRRRIRNLMRKKGEK